MSDENWSRWFRRGFWPLSGGWMYWDIDKIFRIIERIMDRDFEDLSIRNQREQIRERTPSNGSKIREMSPFIYRYSLTKGPNGQPKIMKFGNIKPETRMVMPQINNSEKREPLIDVLESDNHVRVIAEVLGVEKRDINLSGMDNSLTISVKTPQINYYKKIKLPVKVDPKKAKLTYKNGILDVIFPKKKNVQTKGESIRIE